MGRGYKSSRDLEFRLNKDDIIIYEAGDFKRTSKYTGNKNLVEYNNSLITVNKFCRACINERLPDIKKSNINVWITRGLYVNIKNENGELKSFILKNIPILSKYKEYENDILNDKYLKERQTNDINLNELDKIMPRGKTKKKPSISKKDEDK